MNDKKLEVDRTSVRLRAPPPDRKMEELEKEISLLKIEIEFLQKKIKILERGCACFRNNASVAQLVEQGSCKAQVGGSSPLGGSDE